MGPPAPVQLDDAVCLKQGQEAAHEQMLSICRRALPGWQHLTVDDVEFSTVSGGISNINARLTPKKTPQAGQQQQGAAAAPPLLAPVMLKVFGDKTEQLVDREAEKKVVVALGDQGFGPRVHALFANGRIEQWLDCAPVTADEMASPRLAPRVARQLARFHVLRVPGLDARQERTPWGVIEGWLQQAKQLRFDDPEKQARYDAVDLALLEADIRDVRAACAATRSPRVFGHNDLLSGNILILQKQPGFRPGVDEPDPDGPVCFIDYEYGGFTTRGFDVGNHFTEYAGLTGDYSRYPAEPQQQELFWRHYLDESQRLRAAEAEGRPGCLPCLARLALRRGSSDSSKAPSSSAAAANGSGAVQQQQQQADASGGSPPPLPPAQLERLAAEANVWALASHIYWGVWALLQASYSPIEFDYLGFSALRLGEIRRRKERFIGDARRVFGETAGEVLKEAGEVAAGGALLEMQLQS